MHDEPTSDFPPGSLPVGLADQGYLHGQIIDHYRILSLLGEGGFGSVYLAEQSTPVKRRVALKVIKPGMDSRSVMARFEAERQMLALLEHPSIAKVYDAGLTALWRPYFAMELVDGEPITRFCERARASVVDRVRLMIQVCGAVQHAHMKGILHRDLKPSNILVSLIDGKPLPKIIDFGVAKALRQHSNDNLALTEMGQMIGTPNYMSPEQARGSADVDTRADIYALGAILYELLTGVPPLDVKSRTAEGQAAVERAIEEEQPPAPSHRLSRLAKSGSQSTVAGIDAPSTWKRVRGDLDWIVLKCLEKDRSRRYHSAAALADDLERYLRDEPVLACPPSTAYLVAKFVRRHRAAVVAAAIVSVTLVLGVGGIAFALNRAVQEAVAAQRAREVSDAVTAFLTQMIESVDPDEAGRDVTVREVLDRSSKNLATTFADQPLVEARLRHAMGISYWQLGRLTEAAEHLAASVNLRTETLGPKHIDTLRSVANLGAIRLEQGRFTEAEQTLQHAHEGFRETLGTDHVLTLGTASNLAVIYARRGDREASLRMSQDVYDGQRRSLGPDHPHTLGSLSNLASQLMDMGQVEQAETMLRQAVDGWMRSHGPEKAGTLNALHALGTLQRVVGRLDEAEETMRRVVATRIRVLGEGHADTLIAQANLGMILRDAGQVENAERALLDAWAGMRTALGEAHPTTLRVLGFAVDLLEQQGWPNRSIDAANAIKQAALAIFETPDVPANELNSIAYHIMRIEPAHLRDYQLAHLLAMRACEAERMGGGQDLWMYLDTLASAQHAIGLHAEALSSQQEALRLVPASGERYRGEMEERAQAYASAAGGQ
ncbi:MAG TPA: serine/threonine-protein kinase [Phycisphaerales bacterium]|nr:serine/threonine-protein kinase [Phycisphaerales bacterium]HRQ76477.1 serine/threonine-protein kinase [Phycisphaerales bacterium]